MTDIKIKRCADKENLKKLMRYIKATFANKSEVNEEFYTKEQIDSMIESGSGGTGGGGGTGGTVDLTNYYTKTEVDNLLDNIGGGTCSDCYTKSEIDTKLNSKANTSDLSNYYTKPEVDNLLSNISPITSAITLYDLVPDGAEAHNAIWGGRDITAAFDSGEFSEHVADGSFKDIFPGDYITRYPNTINAVNWVIADCDYWINKGDQNNGMETHHVVIVPQSPPPTSKFIAQMNRTNTTEGGYAGSRMYTETIPAFATDIVNAFGSDHILTFRDLITNKVDNGVSSNWDWYDAQCNLMCERMVYGMPAFSSSGWDAGVATRQFSAFRLSEKLINYSRHWWWLRDVVSSTAFAEVDSCGCAYTYGAGYTTGSIRPFALLV